MSAEEPTQEAEVLLQIPNVALDEQVGPSRRPVLEEVEFIVLSLSPTQEELDATNSEMGLPEGTLRRTGDGSPIVVAICGEYKVPICREVPCTRTGPGDFLFQVPNLYVVIRVCPTTPSDLVDALAIVVRTYGVLHEVANLAPYKQLTEQEYRDRRAQEAKERDASLGGGGEYKPQQQPRSAEYSSSAASAGPPTSAGGGRGGGGYQQPQWGAPAPTSESSSSSPSKSNNNNNTDSSANANSSRALPSDRPVPSTTQVSDGGFAQPQYNSSNNSPQRSHSDPSAAPTPGAGQPTMMQQWGEGHADNRRLSTKVATGVTAVGTLAMLGIRKGSGLLARGIGHGASHIVDHTDKCENPVHVPEAAKAHVHRSRMVTKTAVKVTGGLSKTLIGISAVVSDKLSGHLKKGVPNAAQDDDTALGAVKEVGLATVGTVVGLYDAVTEGAREILTAGTGGVTKVVKHKLGDEAGEVAEEGLGIIEDGVTLQMTVKNTGVKGLVKNTVKQTAQKTFTAEQRQ